MSIETYEDEIWAKNGTRQSDSLFTSAKVLAGWVKERVTLQRLNRLFYRLDVLANDSANRGPKPTRDAARAVDAVRGLYTPDNSFSFGVSPSNRVDVGEDYSFLTPAIINGDRKILCMGLSATGGTTGEISIIDVATMTVTTQDGLDSGLPTSGSEEWYPRCAVCDSDYAYILFTDWQTYNFPTRVMAFDLSDWSPHPGWPTDGTVIGYDGPNPPQIIFATADSLAISDPVEDINLGTDAGIYLVSITNGAITDSGAGDVSGMTDGNVVSMCSDGDNVYFIVSDAVVGSQLCSADVTDLTTGCGGTYWPHNLAYDDHPMVACGGGLVVTSNGEADDYFATAHSPAKASLAWYKTNPTNDDLIVGAVSVCYDGFNFWLRGLRTVNSTTRQCLFKIDCHGADFYSAAAAIEDPTQLLTAHAFAADLTHYVSVSNLSKCNLVSDGRDVWFCGCGVSGQDMSNYVFRLPKTNMR